MAEIFTVFGATGTQGGSIIEAVLKSPSLSQKYKIRGTTRDVNKESAKTLISKGVEVVQADLNDAESVMKAAEGSSLIFGVSDFWAVGASESLEAAQGRNIADAAAATGAFLIWSTLPSIKDISNSTLTKAALYESKASVDKYIKSLGVPCVYFVAASYMDLFKTMYGPEKVEGTNKYRLTQPFHPESQLPLLSAAHDVGNFLAPILESPESFAGTRVVAATKYYTMTEIVQAFTSVTGVEVEFHEATDEEYWGVLRGGALDSISSLSEFVRNYDPMGVGGKENLEKSLKRMTEKPEEFEDWLKRNGPWFQD